LFSAEQEEHIQRRYVDPDCLEWLKFNHPEAEVLSDTVTDTPVQFVSPMNMQNDADGMFYCW